VCTINQEGNTMKTEKTIIRQGDVLLTPATKLPAGCIEVPLDKGRYRKLTGAFA
jgi:hypothetical protein